MSWAALRIFRSDRLALHVIQRCPEVRSTSNRLKTNTRRPTFFDLHVDIDKDVYMEVNRTVGVYTVAAQRDYLGYLGKYDNYILQVMKNSNRVPIGDVIKQVDKSMRGIEKSKSEIRDAIVAMAQKGTLRVERITEKRLEVNAA